MNRPTSNRRSLTAIVQKAIASGQHRVDISPDGKVTILPLAIPPAQAEDAALDAEIRELFDGGHAPH
ncbi:hypothetical protein D3C86_1770510 [compost metagenome]